MQTPLAFSFFVVLLAAVQPVTAQDKPILAVMEIEDKTGKFTDKQIQQAATYLRSKLEVAGTFMVVPKSRQEKALIRELRKESYKDCYAEQCQIELGKELAADTILRSAVTEFAGMCSLTSVLIDLAGAAVVGGAHRDFGCSETGLKGAMIAVVKELEQEAPRRGRAEIVDDGRDAPANTTEKSGPVFGVVRFVTDPPGAKVKVDGKFLEGKTPLSGFLRLGGSHVEIVAPEGYLGTHGRELLANKETKEYQLARVPASLVVRAFAPDSQLVAGARVFVDGNLLGVTPGNFGRVVSGRRTIRLEHPSFRTSSKSIVVRADATTEVDFSLTYREGTLKVANATIRDEDYVLSNRRAKVEVAGRSYTTPLEAHLREGTHNIEVTALGGKPLAKKIAIRDGKTTSISPELAADKGILDQWGRVYSKATKDKCPPEKFELGWLDSYGVSLLSEFMPIGPILRAFPAAGFYEDIGLWSWVWNLEASAVALIGLYAIYSMVDSSEFFGSDRIGVKIAGLSGSVVAYWAVDLFMYWDVIPKARRDKCLRKHGYLSCSSQRKADKHATPLILPLLTEHGTGALLQISF